jgi:hypothetical protein
MRRNDEGRSTPEPADAPRTKTNNQVHTSRSASCRRRPTSRRYGAVWKEGFRYGFADAMRLLGRKVDDPALLAAIAELADEFALAGLDGD